MHSALLAENSAESRERESQDRSATDRVSSSTSSGGYYDADKCRAYIANQIKVSKIDRFVAQVSKALEVEASIQERLDDILSMFEKHSAQVTHDLKLCLQKHRRTITLEQSNLNVDEQTLKDLFKPALFVKKLDQYIRSNVKKSKAIMAQLNTVGQIFERLASEHRDKVDIVYTAEEERQAATVIRRSAYQLSIAAIKATSTPVHVNSNNNDIA